MKGTVFLLEDDKSICELVRCVFFWGHLWTVASMDGLRIDQIRIHPQRSGDITEKSE